MSDSVVSAAEMVCVEFAKDFSFHFTHGTIVYQGFSIFGQWRQHHTNNSCLISKNTKQVLFKVEHEYCK